MAPTGGLKEEQKRRIEDNRKALTKRIKGKIKSPFSSTPANSNQQEKISKSVCRNMHDAIQQQTENFAT